MTFRLAVFSGILGAAASCLAKFALSKDSPVGSWATTLCLQTLQKDGIPQLIFQWNNIDYFVCDIIPWLPRGICLLLMIGCNIIMAGIFLEGMQQSGSVVGTALASAANFTTSAFLGIVLWGEVVSTQWCVGFVTVVAGVALLSGVQFIEQQDDERSSASKKKV